MEADLSSGLARLRGRSLAELRVRASQALSARLERLQLSIAPDARRHAHPSDQSLPLPFEGHITPRDDVALLVQADPAFARSLDSRVAALHAGRMNLLGLRDVAVGNPPSWHREPRSGVVAPRLHWSRIAHLDIRTAGDHKLLWEPNRHQYLLAPALRWLARGDAADLQLVERHLQSWLQENPARVGINWSSSLEVAYRAISWCWLLSLLRDAPWSTGLRTQLLAALEDHGAHIERYLSVYFSPNTHLTGEALGLFYVGCLLPGARARHWQRLGAQLLDEWLPRQVHSDGVYFEQATQYQRYTADILLHYLLLARGVGWQPAIDLEQLLSRVVDVLRSLVDGRGEMPLIGDDDGGLLLPLDETGPEQLAGFLLTAATAVKRSDWLLPGEPLRASSYLLCGAAATARTLQMPRGMPVWRDRYFAEGGLAVLRDGWSERDAVAVIDAGPHGTLNCGHAHADALAFTLSLGRQPLFVDRGTCSYVGAERNEYRRTAAHNTIELDDESSIEPTGPFQWREIPPRASGRLLSEGPMRAFEGLAAGHANTGRPSLHRRVIAHMIRGAWLVYDEVRRSDVHRVVSRLQLAPGLEASTRHDGSLHVLGEHGTSAIAALLPLGHPMMRIKARDVSPRYGARVPAVLVELEADEGLRVACVVVPLAEGATSFRRLDDGWEWADEAGIHRVEYRPSADVELNWSCEDRIAHVHELTILSVDLTAGGIGPPRVDDSRPASVVLSATASPPTIGEGS